MSNRSRKGEKNYAKYRRSIKEDNCVFCEIDQDSNEFIEETDSFKVIKNIFGYSLWDGQNVEEHLMIVPKQHVDTLSALNPVQSQEFVKLMSSYESTGYNVWARAPQSKQKSVVHQHTHLIKPGKKSAKFILFLNKPYVRLSR